MSKTWQEVADNAPNNWIVIDGNIYNPTSFLDKHPGGPAIIRNRAGKDVTQFYNGVGHSLAAKEQMKQYFVAKIDLKSTPQKWQKDPDVKIMMQLSIIVVIGVAFYLLFLYK